ncbi:MAG: hypothetical protein HC933_07985 [Pleurocapsa sp. SU_196_0]|nr:hypothetical protein [Pleurocapsa sp. SU_196_0]
MYAVRARQGNTESRSLLIVSRLGLVTKRGTEKSLTWTMDAISGEPRAARVYALSAGKDAVNSIAEKNGLVRWNSDTNNTIYLARFGASWAISGSSVASWNVRKTLGYVYTERPVYRPGDTVFFKGILRDGQTLQPRASLGVRVRVFNREDNSEIFKGTARTNEFGSFALQTDLSSRVRTGQYSVEVRGEGGGDDGGQFFGAFSVEAYQKPEFAVTVTLPAKAVQGDTVRAKIAATYLFGGKVGGARVKYSVQRQRVYDYWWYASQSDREEQIAEQRLEAYQSGYSLDWYDWYQPPAETIIQEQGRLNAQGELELPIPISRNKDREEFKYTLTASVEDETRQVVTGGASLSAPPASLTVAVQSKGYAYSVGERVDLDVQTRDLSNKGVAATVRLEVQREFWNREGEVKNVIARLETRTNASGVGSAGFTPSKSGYYRVTASVADAKNRVASSQWYVWVTGDSSEVWYYRFDDLELTLDKARYAPGDLVTVLVQNPNPDSERAVDPGRQGFG